MSENTVQSREPAKPGAQPGGTGGIPQFMVDLAKNAPAMMWVFTGTTFLSALLLFAIQPMFAKMVLPVLGGSPSVWSVSVFFFQAALLARLHLRALPHQQGAAASHRHHPSRRLHRGLHLSSHRSFEVVGRAAARRALSLAARHVRVVDRPAVHRGFRQRAAAAGLVRQKRASQCARSLFHVCRQQPGQPDRASRLSLRARACLWRQPAQPHLGLRLRPARDLDRHLVLPDARRAGGRRAGGAGCAGRRARRDGSGADAATAPGLGRPFVRAGRPGDGLHGARDHRRGIGPAAVGDPAGALSADVRAGVPRQPADRARVAAVPAPDRAGGGADHAVADPARQLVRHQLDRRCGVLHDRHAGAPNAL